MCVPADGVAGIKRFVLDSIVGAGGKPCPPGIVGVGIGGSADYAMHLAKEAIARPVGTRNPDPIVAQLEDELYDLLNETGIGPMGLGGDVTVLQCHIEHADTHMTLNPVAVNYQCWAARARSRARRRGRDHRLRPGGLMAPMAATSSPSPSPTRRRSASSAPATRCTSHGHIIGIRDRTQIRIFDQGVEPPMDLARRVPSAHRAGRAQARRRASTRRSASARPRARAWCASPSRSARDYGVRAICGKGGFPTRRSSRCSSYGMVYFAIVGGAAALETTQIEEIEEVAWEELMPECLWKFRVKDFGPLTVGIDAHGSSLYHDVQEAAKKRWRSSMPASDGFFDLRPPASRASGLTHVIDKGLDLRAVEDLFDTAGEYVDIVKLGWGTGYVTHNLEKKIALYRSFDTPVVCGGTLFEAVVARGQARRVQALARRSTGFSHVEISDGTIDIPREQKLELDRRVRPRLRRPLGGRLEGLRGRLRALPVGAVAQGGARGRGVEGDHRGPRGRHRGHLPSDRRHAHRPDRRDRPRDRPLGASSSRRRRSRSQAWFVQNFGPDVNLGNIPPEEVIPLETLRLGLRADTLKEVLLGEHAALTD